MSSVTIFAPAPILTVTIEATPEGPDVHVHAGGQGVWQARMLRGMGIDVTLCCVLSGENGRTLRHLLNDEGIRVVAVERDGRSSVYVHDRRDGDRTELVETGGDPLVRHDLDELYGLMLREALTGEFAILSGPAADDVLPADVYRRLAADLGGNGCRVIVDLAGERLAAAVAGGVELAKVSDDELLDTGRIDAKAQDEIIRAMQTLVEEGARAVVVTRADGPFLLLSDHEVTEITPPEMQVVDTAGAGDSLTAAVTAALLRGEPLHDAVTLGAAAGALNVTRHGLGTGDEGAIAQLRKRVRSRAIESTGTTTDTASRTGSDT